MCVLSFDRSIVYLTILLVFTITQSYLRLDSTHDSHRSSAGTGPVQATGTAWVFSCGQVTCDETCATIGTSCNAEGMRAVDTEEKGKYVLGLVDQFATFLSGLDQKDAPVIDYYSPFRSEYFWVRYIINEIPIESCW